MPRPQVNAYVEQRIKDKIPELLKHYKVDSVSEFISGMFRRAIQEMEEEKQEVLGKERNKVVSITDTLSHIEAKKNDNVSNNKDTLSDTLSVEVTKRYEEDKEGRYTLSCPQCGSEELIQIDDAWYCTHCQLQYNDIGKEK